VATFVLVHTHEPRECASAFAAWRGFASPLRRSRAIGSCERGGHRIFWIVNADSEQAALALLPQFVADRTEASEVSEVPIP
jgi:hypothetical protein